MKEKILLQRKFKTRTNEGSIIKCTACLHQIGEQKPYFSITTERGADHETILEAFEPTFIEDDIRLLVSLHLSDENGWPMHAVSNGIYYLEHGEFGKYADHMRCIMEKAESDAKIMRGFPNRTGWMEANIKKCFEKQWKEEAKRAKEILSEPDYEDESIEEFDNDPKEKLLLKLDEDIYEVDYGHIIGEVYELTDGYNRWIVAENSKRAGEGAREYWKDMAKNDPTEFAAIVGEKTLVAWALNQYAGPGSTQARNLEEWLDLFLDAPEEEWARDDGIERDGKISVALAEELGFDNNDKENLWADVVVYKS